ncbi:PhoD-like phosphatase-domain-containing protein [Vararia minispora EC-137]|uniref:PhoD-like phosphatase-domain-containing protein n=1 Tax=Vararia minispora EC-137 TaxID=1314806 RepID=A0ACB8QCU2_9AGAM|nr:PhoD-like phosphatase-domain-containing protein [Vararia minispora EC-137]
MSFAFYAAGIASTVFRVIVYVFLRIIPASHIPSVLPLFYLAYLVPTLFLHTAQDTSYIQIFKEKEANGVKHDVPVNGRRVLVVLPHQPTRSSYFESLVDAFFGLQRDRKLKRVTFLINTLCLAACFDLVFEPYFDRAADVTFTRVGALTPDSAKIVVRVPPPLASNKSSVQLLWRKIPSDVLATSTAAWTDGPLLTLIQDLDWVATAQINGLWPNTNYEYVLAHPNKTHLGYPISPIQFRTFPDPKIPGGSHFRFLATSCMIPNFPWAPLQGRTIKGFDYMADYLFSQSEPATPSQVIPIILDDNDTSVSLDESRSLNNSAARKLVKQPEEKLIQHPRTEFMLFLGDFIYADVPWYFGDDREEYRRMYRRVYNSPSFRKVYEKLPILHEYDDHEIINNYEGKSNDTGPFINASDAFTIYQGNANYAPLEIGQHYYAFRYGDIAYFVMDTRRYRSGMDESPATRTMLGERQLTSFYHWLGKVNNTATFKFIVTSVPFTSLWTGDAQADSWAGYASEKAALLEALHTVPNVYILSGDRHEFAAIEFNGPTASSNPVFEISTSPLNQFYIPFVRTLKSQSDVYVKRYAKFPIPDDTTDKLQYEELEIDLPQERVLKYIATGNHKWATFEVDSTNPQRPLLHLELVINGQPAYHHTFEGTPVKLRSASSAISVVTDSLRDVLGRVGIAPGKWF